MEAKTILIYGTGGIALALTGYGISLYNAAQALEVVVDKKDFHIYPDIKHMKMCFKIKVAIKNGSNFNFPITKPLISLGIENKEIFSTRNSLNTLKQYNVKANDTTSLDDFVFEMGLFEFANLAKSLVANVSNLSAILLEAVGDLWNQGGLSSIPQISDKVKEILLTKGIKIQYKYNFSYYLFGFFPIDLSEKTWQNAY